MIKEPLIYLLRGYRYFLSPWLGNSCRFDPTCSEYCLQCLHQFSTAYAIWLSFRRLIRCHPWSAGGLDPIPDEAR